MATLQHHRRLPIHGTEVRCEPKYEGAVTVRIANHASQPHQQETVKVANSGGGAGGGSGAVNKVNPILHKYSISSSCSSGESGTRPKFMTTLRRWRTLPPLFERSAAQCWDPKFDSSILEEACRERCFPQTQRRFRYVLFYLAVAAALWGVYFAVNNDRCDTMTYLAPTAAFLLLLCLLFFFTLTYLYTRVYSGISLLLIVITFAFTLAPQMETARYFDLEWGEGGGGNATHPPPPPRTLTSAQAPCISPVGTFSLCMEVLLLLYSVLHVRLYASVLLGLLYSVLFEVLGLLLLLRRTPDVGAAAGGGVGPASDWDTLRWLVPGKALLHLCAHVIGIHLFIMSEVRSRTTFRKVGHAIMHGKELEVEKALKERMIHSVMPRRVADELMKQGDDEGGGGGENAGKRYSAGACSTSAVMVGGGGVGGGPKNHYHKRKKTSIPRGQIIFRPFNMKRMEPVSILFADIVGFTKMSANKSAHVLVDLLNDLFGRFDRLCELTCCEKISTLGDCYYCVAGCPEPREDHAYCCVEMGLGMIQAIEQFCQETRETVDMRVGVHTGTVLCGILGIKRFKFDVWSNDVNLANLMEQLGVAGKVHLSEATGRFLDDRYQREDGQVAERAGQTVMENFLLRGGCVLVFTCFNRRILSRSGWVLKPARGSSSTGLCPAGEIGDETPLNGCQEEHKMACHSPRAANGLLSPLSLEGVVRASRTSLCDTLQEREKKTGTGTSGTAALDHSALLLRAKQPGEKSDAHFVEVIREDSLMKDYFFKPPINKISLNFLARPLENAYRSSYQKEVKTQVRVQTFASTTFSSFLDVLLSCFVFLALTLACFLPVLVGSAPAAPAALALSPLAGLLELASLVLSIRMVFYLDSVMRCTRTLLKVVSGWIPRHVVGAVLVSLPAVSVFSHFPCAERLPLQVTMFLCCATILAIIQYCNFCQLSFWMRSLLATSTGAVLLLLLYNPAPDPGLSPLDFLLHEAILAFFLLLLLVWFLNREFEVSYRLHYHGNVEADKHQLNIQNMRDQAEWLLGNIIPIHVAEQLKLTQSYSKNHDNVGVIFASIVNFSEFYEESYEGGKECYRVLNELIGDFDELLRKSEFANVEKIKTIGATYMAASGLNVQQVAESEDAHPHAHVRALFHFALEMMGVLDDFNKNMLGFGFKLRIGFNHGPLTAGVIGTTKLLYDIWGDTVNIASRMDSTGLECQVQVSEESHGVLHSMGMEFDYRGTVNVKGKGQMRTFLYPKREGGDSRPGSQGKLGAGGIAIAGGPSPTADATDRRSESVVEATGQHPGHAEPKEAREEGYRDAAHPPGPSPLQGPYPPSPAALQPEHCAPQVPFMVQALQEAKGEEEEADELTNLNEEFYSRL
uniref:adenylate cyclase n=1 Tax=Gadus morhua TaxID=8049 RepID=A0A8C4ZJJ2_GADMO